MIPCCTTLQWCQAVPNYMFSYARLYCIICTVMPGCTTLQVHWYQAILHNLYSNSRLYYISCTVMPGCTTLHAQWCQAVQHYMYSDAKLYMCSRVSPKAPFLKKSRKTAVNWPFLTKNILTIFMNFFLICSKTVLSRGLQFFCVAFSVPKRLIWANKKKFGNFFKFFTIRGVPYGQKVTRSRKKGQK